MKQGRRYPTAPTLRAALAKRHQINVCLSTVKNDLKAIGTVCRVRPKTACRSERVTNLRYEFALEHRRTRAEDVVFSDEAWMHDNEHAASSRMEYLRPGEDATPREHMKRPKIRLMVWGAIGVGYKSPLVLIKGMVTGKSYVRTCLQRIVPSLGGKHFMHDGASPHRASRPYLDRKGVNTMNWPPYSPHLNPIETMWELMHRRVSLLQPRSLTALKVIALKVWDEYPQEAIDRLVRRWPEKIAHTIKTKGEAF